MSNSDDLNSRIFNGVEIEDGQLWVAKDWVVNLFEVDDYTVRNHYSRILETSLNDLKFVRRFKRKTQTGCYRKLFYNLVSLIELGRSFSISKYERVSSRAQEVLEVHIPKIKALLEEGDSKKVAEYIEPLLVKEKFEELEDFVSDGQLWLSLSQFSDFVGLCFKTVSRYSKKVFETSGLERESVIRRFLKPNSARVNYPDDFYNLEFITEVGKALLLSHEGVTHYKAQELLEVHIPKIKALLEEGDSKKVAEYVEPLIVKEEFEEIKDFVSGGQLWLSLSQLSDFIGVGYTTISRYYKKYSRLQD